MKHITTKICLATFHHKYKSFKTLSDILHFPGNSKIFLNWQDKTTIQTDMEVNYLDVYVTYQF